MDHPQARAALDAVKDTEFKMAARMRWPFWRHAIVGVIMVLLLLGVALPSPSQIAIFGVVLLTLFLVIRDDKRRHGMFVSGYQKGRTAWVLTVQLILSFGALLATISWIDDPLGNPLFWALEAFVLIASTALSLLWEKVYRADIRGGRV